MQAIILRNPNALMVPEVGGLLERALNSTPYMAPRGLADVAGDLIDYVQDPQHFLILGAEKGAFRGVVMMNLPVRRLFPTPQITLMYNEGTRPLLKVMQAKALEIIQQNGYTKAWGVNASGRSDRAWKKVFEFENVEVQPLGTFFEFQIE